MPVLDHTLIYIADPADAEWPHAPTTQLVKIDDCDVNRSGFFLQWIRFPGTQEVVTFGQMGEDGNVQAASRHTGGTLDIGLGYKVLENSTTQAEGIAQMSADWSAIQNAIDVEHGVLVIQIKGKEEPLYYDFDRSELPQQLDGQSEPWVTVTDFLVAPENVVLQLNVNQPWPRSAPVTLGPFSVTNEVGSRTALITNPGNRPSEVQAIYSPTAGSVIGWRHSFATTGNLTERATHISTALAGATMKQDTASEAETGAEGGNAAVTDFTGPEFAPRVRQPYTITDPTAMVGVHKVWVRVKKVDGTTDEAEFAAQVFAGFSDDPMGQVRAHKRRKTIDLSDPGAAWTEVFMGYVIVPKGTLSMNLDIWAERLDGDWSLAWDQIILEPADYFWACFGSPGFRLGEWGRRRYPADELDGTGTLKRLVYRLDEDGEIARTDPTAGFALEAGNYEGVFPVSLRNPTDAKVVLGEAQVIKNPSGTPSTKAKVRLRTTKRLRTERRRRVFFNVSAVEEAAGDKFRPQVEQTASTLGGRRIGVKSILLRYLRGVTSDEEARVDSNIWTRTSQAHDVTTGAPLFGMPHEGWLPKLPPGNALAVVSSIDAPTDAGWDSVDEEEPVAPSTLTRETEVTYIVTPRYGHPLGGS